MNIIGATEIHCEYFCLIHIDNVRIIATPNDGVVFESEIATIVNKVKYK
jgi:hypothetical protein